MEGIGRASIVGEPGIDASVAPAEVIVMGRSQESFQTHAAFFQNAPGRKIATVAGCLDAIRANVIEQEPHHGKNRLRRDSMVPPSPSHAKSQTHLVQRLVHLHHGNGTDKRCIPLYGPTKRIVSGIFPHPLFQDVPAFLHALMGRPQKILGHLKIARPTEEHGRSVINREPTKRQMFRPQDRRAAKFHERSLNGTKGSGGTGCSAMHFSIQTISRHEPNLYPHLVKCATVWKPSFS